MSLDPDTFRAALGRFATGVTIVTCTDAQGTDHGITVSAFCSVSLHPPLVLICIDHKASMHAPLLEAPGFAVNMLSSSQEGLARRFADPDGHRFTGVGFTRGERGAALLDGALAAVECCRLYQYDGGDHTIIVGEAEGAIVRHGSPLLYYRGGFAQLDR